METEQLVTLPDPVTVFFIVAVAMTQCIGTNIATFNPELVEFMKLDDPTTLRAKRELLQMLTELHLCCMIKASLEGSGHVRFTETVSAQFTNLSAFDKRFVTDVL
jgi:hypothetical protein